MSRGRAKDRSALEDRIGYHFADKTLLEVFRHPPLH